jgi:hypothetical protein
MGEKERRNYVDIVDHNVILIIVIPFLDERIVHIPASNSDNNIDIVGFLRQTVPTILVQFIQK